MHCLLCYTAAQHLSVHRRREGKRRNSFTPCCKHTENAKEGVRGKKMEMESGDVERERERGPKKMNGRAERAASIGKLYNECLSLASMMDESGMVFVTNAIFFESLCCFPVQGRALCCCAEPARASP